MLEIGQSTTVTIQARKKWNYTGIQLSSDQEYNLEKKANGSIGRKTLMQMGRLAVKSHLKAAACSEGELVCSNRCS
jgi:hypothetical protein